MAAFPRLPVLIRHLPTAAGIGAGIAVAATIAVLATGTLEHLAWTSGIAALVPAAAPPLGGTARLLLVLGGGVVTGAVVWAALFLLVGPGGFLAPKDSATPVVKRASVRRADAHPDAPPRRPMSAADLGTPLMEVPTMPPVEQPPVEHPPVEQPLPRELDQPLAAFDPGAIPAAPRVAQRALPALAPGERLDTFELPPPSPSRPSPLPVRREPQTIDSLLRRLEEGAGRRSARA